MRNTIQYPVLPEEVQKVLKDATDELINVPPDEMRIGDMRPMIFGYVADYLDLNRHDFERFLLSQPTNGPKTR